jgi:RNA polymerase sigma-70 factor (ECF subfamily)
MAVMEAGEDDLALVEAWRRADAGAARRIVVLHAPAMTRVALALGSRAEDAEEIVQDALLHAHRSLDRFDARRGSLRSWLVGVTANRARQVRRGLARYGGFLARLRREPYETAPPASMHADVEFARRRLAALPAREREAFVLVEVEELTSAEAARIMHVADSTVRVLLNRARRRLRGESAPEPAHALRAEGRGK